MKASHSPLVQNAQDQRLDSSFSRTLLTSRNYRGPRLLQTIRGRPEVSPTSPATANASTTREMHPLTEDEINALPISSDEEEEATIQQKASPRSPSSVKRSVEDDEATLPPKKKTRGETKPVRSSKRKLKEPEPIPEAEVESRSQKQQEISTPDFPDFLSQSSQSKKRNTAKFGKANTYTRPSSQTTKFLDPGELPNTPRKSRTTSFKIVDSPASSKKRTPRKKQIDIEIPSSASKGEEATVVFQLPNELDLPKSSSISTDLSLLFDANEAAEGTSRKRSGSTSSLSSVDSLASYELPEARKNELRSGVAEQHQLPRGHVRCPLCRSAVDLATLPPSSSSTLKRDPSTLPLRKQQLFCNTHRTYDAQVLWRRRGYPDIDWIDLEKHRILKHIPYLRQILDSKQPSFYLDNLESQIKSARGNRSKIRRYLANDIVEVVKLGYYGPKGAKIMGNTITVEMAIQLKKSLETDKTVRVAGVSGYISAVLLPELLVRVVMEDMEIDEEKARDAISESTEAGMILWPDDDHVVVEVDDTNNVL